MKSGIYIIISPTANVYIGQSVNVDARVRTYQKGHCKTQRRLYNSIQKHGWNNHFYEIIEYCPIESLNERERYWQDDYQVITSEYGMNLKLTTTNSKSGITSDETKRKQSEVQKGRILSEEHKMKISIANTGFKKSPETIAKFKEAMKDYRPNDETKRKLSEKLKGHPVSDETRRKISEAVKRRYQIKKENAMISTP